jgi:hypothetical protein
MLVKTLKSNEAFRVFASKYSNPVFQCTNCLMLDAYFWGKAKFIWSESFLVKGKILKKRFRHSVVFPGQALMIFIIENLVGKKFSHFINLFLPIRYLFWKKLKTLITNNLQKHKSSC